MVGVPWSNEVNRKGLTLFEMLIALLITSLLSGTITFIFVSLLKGWDYQSRRLDVKLETSRSLDTVIHDLKETLSITTAENRNITIWFRDTDLDGVQDAGEVVTFSWDGVSGSSLTRTQVTSKIIANYITNFQLNYFDEDNEELPSPVNPQSERDEIKLITVTIASSKGSETVTLRSNAKLRNR